MHVPKPCVSNQKDVDGCRFLSVFSRKHGRRSSGKVRRRPRQWHVQGRFSMTCPELDEETTAHNEWVRLNRQGEKGAVCSVALADRASRTGNVGQG